MTEFKEEKETSTEGAQPVAKPSSTIDEIEKVVELENELSKQLEEKENYKKAALSKEEELKIAKAKIKALTEIPPKEKPQEPEPKEQVVIEDKPKVVEPTGYNPEKEAKAQFLKMYPNVNMQKVLENYRGGKLDTVTEIVSALEDAKDYSDFKSGNTNSSNALSSQGGGVSEVENKYQQKVTSKDIEISKKFFNGNLERYLKHKQNN